MENYELKRFIKEIIMEFHDTGIPDFYKRDVKIPKFKKINKIITVVGPRRAGKTYLLYQIMNEKMKVGKDITDFLYINFENERISDIRKEQLNYILEGYNELYPDKKPILFFDEIQNIRGWDKFIRRLQEQRYTVYITGSNSNLLSREIATSLRGRAYSIELFPLSFKEFLVFRGVKLKENWEYGKLQHKVKKMFDDYVRLSGFPEIVLENRLGIIDDYFKTIFYRDIIERYNIKNRDLMDLLMKYIIKNYSQEFSMNKFHNFAKSLNYKSSTSVIHSYVGMLKEVYFLDLITPRHKGKKELSYSKKNYVMDHAFINYYVPDKDIGRMLENIVYLELRRREKMINYYKNGFECDFITSNKSIQVTYTLNQDNYDREVKGILEASKMFKHSNEIITYDTEDTIKIGGREIQVLPVWKWLLK
ncbi:ATP-binding protein [Candidatus Micrarchaeota archaeon]|nr:ATP-binding protein [Candidatus Micrarchaeota archaeon]